MSRLRSTAGSLIWYCLAAMPLAAQDVRMLASRLEREIATVRERKAAVDGWREENRRFKNATDSVMIANGAIKVVATANAAELAREAARIADSVLRAYPSVTEAVRGAVVAISVDTARRCLGCDEVAVVRYSSGPGSGAARDNAELIPDAIARMIEEATMSRALDRSRGAYFKWHRANPPQRPEDYEIIDWGEVRFDILESRSLLGPRCYKGEIGACTMQLGLHTVDDPVMAWYDSLARFDAVSDYAERGRRFSRESTERCLAGDDAACGRVLHALHMFELPPAGAAPRNALMRQAIIIGGAGAVDRLLAGKGTAGEALAAAAGVPLDSVVKVWHLKLQDASLGSDDVTIVMVFVALGWIGLLFGLSTRISRWR